MIFLFGLGELVGGLPGGEERKVPIQEVGTA